MLFFEGALVSAVLRAERIYTKQTEGIYYRPRATHGFVYYLSGRCRYVWRDETEFVAEKGMFLYLPKGKIYEIHPECDSSCILLNVDTVHEARESAFMLPVSLAVYDRFVHCIHIMSRKEIGYQANVIGEIYRIVSMIQLEKSEKKYMPRSAYEKIEPAVNYIHEHYLNARLSIAELAELCGISERYLGRLFYEYYGMYPKQYIIRMRMDLARSLLSGSNEPISHIAESCGFQNVYYFSRAFKQYIGMTPSEARRQNGSGEEQLFPATKFSEQ